MAAQVLTHIAFALVAIELSLIARYALVRIGDARHAGVTTTHPAGPEAALYFLLPALREQNSVATTLATFRSLCEGRRNVRAIVITTEREEHEKARFAFAQSTAETVLDWKRAHDPEDFILHLHYPRVDGNKSDQLNFAMEWLSRNGADPADFAAVYDFDACPPPQTVDDFRRLSTQRRYDAMQQVPLPIRKLDRALAEGRHAVVAESLLHMLQRSLPIEKWRPQFNDRLGWGILPHYLCGAGLYVRLGYFDERGPFPPVDDVPFGYRLYVLGARIGALPSYNLVEAHRSIRAVVNSNVFVCRGVLQYFTEGAHAVRSAGSFGALVRSLLLIVFGLFETFEFMLSPAFLVVALWVGVATGTPVLWATTLVLLMLPSLAVVMTRGLVREQTGTTPSAGDWLRVCAIAPARRFWRSLGPALFFWRKIKSLVVKAPVVYAKTER
jgi:hypothetical protein